MRDTLFTIENRKAGSKLSFYMRDDFKIGIAFDIDVDSIPTIYFEASVGELIEVTRLWGNKILDRVKKQ